MEDVFFKIEQMRRQQQEVAGPLFAKLSTAETWLELLRWMVKERSEDFTTQMLEVAAMATWALKECKQEAMQLSTTCDEDDEETDLGEELASCQPAKRFSWEP